MSLEKGEFIMNQSYLIEAVERDCPYCNEVHTIEKRTRMSSMLIKGEPVQFDEHYFFCPLCAEDDQNEFVPADMMDKNLQKARNAYRSSHGLLTSDEIAEIRANYGLSQSDLALILGWGEITITRYESKSIQDETYDQIMRMFRDDATFALQQLKRQASRFGVEKYSQIKATILTKVKEVGVCQLIIRTIEAQYAAYDKPSDFNGNQRLDLEKLGRVMAFFAQYEKNLYKVKLMKLLWYSDALSFKQRGRTISGLVYAHKPYGALPIANSDIIYLPAVNVEEIEINDNTSYRITAASGMSLDGFDAEEVDIIYRVVRKFKNMSTQQIVDYMHEENAYKDTAMNQIIPFSKCLTLKDF
jgi:putative zinc finger/helix-turn-helix YgiT family protein